MATNGLDAPQPVEHRHDYIAFVDAIQANNLRMGDLIKHIETLDKRIDMQHHKCRFEEDEARAMHRFGQSMANGGWDKFQAVLDFGSTLLQVRKAGTVAFVGLMVAGLVGVIWLGIKTKLGAQP